MRRAYEACPEHDAIPGQELEDWMTAKRELLPSLSPDFKESDGFVHELASVPGFKSHEIAVGVDPHSMVVLAQRGKEAELRSSPVVDRCAGGQNDLRESEKPGCAVNCASEEPKESQSCGCAPACLDEDESINTDVMRDGLPKQMFCVRE